MTGTQLEALLAIEEIKRVFAGRLHCMDTKQWDRYGSFHTGDVVSDAWQGAPSVVGRDALTAAIRATLDGPVAVTSVHHGHTPQIELTTDDAARGVWAMEDRLWWNDEDHEEHLHGFGHYHEHYRKVDGQWLISYRRLTRLRVDATPGFSRYRRS